MDRLIVAAPVFPQALNSEDFIICTINGTKGAIAWVTHDPRCDKKCGLDQKCSDLNRQYRTAAHNRLFTAVD